jgi:hypothetical protein
MRSEALPFFDDRVERRGNRAADRHRRARGDRSGARHLVVTVAMRDLDDLGRDAEVVGHEAAIDRAVPLPARMHADRQQKLSGPGKGDGGTLARLAPGDLEEARDAQAAPFAPRLRRRPARRETRNIGAGERLAEHGCEIAAVISGSDCSLVGHARGCDEVAAADLDAIDAGGARRLVDLTQVRLRRRV